MGKLRFGSKPGSGFTQPTQSVTQGTNAHRAAINHGTPLNANGNNNDDDNNNNGNGNGNGNNNRGTNLRKEVWDDPTIKKGEWKAGDDDTETRDITTTQTGTGTTVIPKQEVERIVKPGEPGYDEWLAAVTEDPSIEDKYKDQTIVEPLSKENIETETRGIEPVVEEESVVEEPVIEDPDQVKMRETTKIQMKPKKRPGWFRRGENVATAQQLQSGDVDFLGGSTDYHNYETGRIGSDEESNIFRNQGNIELAAGDVPETTSLSRQTRSKAGQLFQKGLNIFRPASMDVDTKYVPGSMVKGSRAKGTGWGGVNIPQQTHTRSSNVVTGTFDPELNQYVRNTDDANNEITEDDDSTR